MGWRDDQDITSSSHSLDTRIESFVKCVDRMLSGEPLPVTLLWMKLR